MKHFILIYLWVLPILGSALDSKIGEMGGVNFYEPHEQDSFLTSTLIRGRLYLDIPEEVLGKPILWTRIGSSNQYESKQVVFTRFRDDILMEEHRIWSESGIWIPLKEDKSLEKNIMGIFPMLKGHGESRGCRIDITDILLGSTIAWKRARGGPLVSNMSQILDHKNSGHKVIVKTRRCVLKNEVRLSNTVYFSFYALPKPMDIRRFDYRMGFRYEDVGSMGNATKNYIASIARWRLEKLHQGKETSVPVKPITFVMSPNIPIKWRPYVKAGIEEWLPSFESAGFKDAIVVREVDTLDNWDRYGLDHSIIRWNRSQNVRTYRDGSGGSTVAMVIDLRSGEIIKSDILLGSSLEHLTDQYFIRCAALDKRALSFPFPDELMGELIQSLVAHEAGHTFGIKDNHYGEYSYPVNKMGDASWLETMGHTTSIMTYARHNNIAQPKDSVPPSLLIQKVGPTDNYYIQWAYTAFSKEMSPEEETSVLERIIRWQDSIPWFRYNTSQYEIIGPAATNEVVETNDPVIGTSLALKNLKRALELLPEACQDLKDNTTMERIYTKALELWYYNMKSVISLLGGYEIFYKSMDQPGNMYTPIPLESQKEALDFLIANAFDPPNWLVRPDFMVKIRYSTYPDKVTADQQRLLLELLRPQRMKRFEQMETINGYERTLQWYLENLQKGLFKELIENSDYVKPRRQEIQMTYIERLIWAIGQERKHFDPTKKALDHTDYTRGLMMGQLKVLRKEIKKSIKRNRGTQSLGHWKRCLSKLDKLLEP
ncbi:zinc-dependent metalloprotease [Flagellimonas algicola]|uniref:EcxA zinc-binding domain-containing protein n=1 Tax=Flagellimonas algicola TaxID=2583815 RepID=A0ABY2WHK2_9FLAO|nr:zinc-dependent metalloprotease [Allomuricauda algicola]TMU50748.1 hypothetical protein FGG15_18295 [Allomuricauda algicola]